MKSGVNKVYHDKSQVLKVRDIVTAPTTLCDRGSSEQPPGLPGEVLLAFLLLTSTSPREPCSQKA